MTTISTVAFRAPFAAAPGQRDSSMPGLLLRIFVTFVILASLSIAAFIQFEPKNL
jgi:hypothetical protein